VTPAEVLATAQELVQLHGGKVVYRMGADLDGNPIGCDCSAFVARCCRQRKNADGIWYNTDRIYDDAIKPSGNARWRRIDVPVPGCIGVYPGKTRNGNRIAGHVWIVQDPARCLTLECSSSGKGIAGRVRAAWFTAGALGNGRPIIWAKFIG
jgi:hypothetical protein